MRQAVWCPICAWRTRTHQRMMLHEIWHDISTPQLETIYQMATRWKKEEQDRIWEEIKPKLVERGQWVPPGDII